MSEDQPKERKDTDKVPHSLGQAGKFQALRDAIKERFREEGLDPAEIEAYGGSLVIRAVLNRTGTRGIVRVAVEPAWLDAAPIPTLVERFMRDYADGVKRFRRESGLPEKT